MYNTQELAAMTVNELKDVMKQKGMSQKPGENKLDIIRRIEAHNAMLTQPAKEEAKPKEEKKQEVLVGATEEMLRQEAEKYSSIGFQLQFLDNGNSWHIKCKGAEDTGSCMQPMTVIRNKFRLVANGARNPRKVRTQGGYAFVQ